jgi:hypothetical protein
VGVESWAGDRKILIYLFFIDQNIIWLSIFKVSNLDRHFFQHYINCSFDRAPFIKDGSISGYVCFWGLSILYCSASELIQTSGKTFWKWEHVITMPLPLQWTSRNIASVHHKAASIIMSRVLVTKTGSGLVIGFINRLQLVTTNNYNTVPNFHSTSTPRLFPLVFTIRFLATDLNPGIITGSHFKYHCTKSLLIIINTAMSLFLHFMVHCYTL